MIKLHYKDTIKMAFLKDTPTDRAVFEKNILLLFWLEWRKIKTMAPDTAKTIRQLIKRTAMTIALYLVCLFPLEERLYSEGMYSSSLHVCFGFKELTLIWKTDMKPSDIVDKVKCEIIVEKTDTITVLVRCAQWYLYTAHIKTIYMCILKWYTSLKMPNAIFLHHTY